MTTGPDTFDNLLAGWLRPAPAPAGLESRILAGLRTAPGRDQAGTALGAGLLDRLAVAASERGVVALDFDKTLPAPQGAAARRFAGQARDELAEYFAGRRAFFRVPVDLERLPGFQRRVLQTALRIPFGEARSYSWIARAIRNPGAVRAVGTALGRNPVPFIVPCHRVLRSDGSLGGYAWGLDLKRRLLELEHSTPVLEGCTSTRIVCRTGCRSGGRLRPDHRVLFASLDDARSVGYRTCRACHPEAAAAS
jgi:O-6-methylguanine DNA methyltransferase